ncbi:transcription factor PCL1-like [Bidens hawaiensis]|uniref:transcription factor PCL1-like n=1 Tax=Bidens hawaiensis TaxID=980011 RepID=UPI00404A469B
MGEEVRITDYDVTGGDRVTEWEAGLPTAADLPPLSQLLISPELASAFSITPEPHRSMIDVDRASRDTLWTLRPQSQPHVMNKINDFKSVSDDREEEIVLEGEETVDLTRDGSPLRKLQRVDSSGAGGGGGEEADSARTSKRIRLVWTPQLHKRFVEVVAHLGVKNAVPKTIMQLMNVEGLTRENVASHLQKYRLYLKRMQGLSNEGPSPSDHLFASTPVPKSLHDSGGASGNEIGHGRVPIPMPYPPQMVPMPYPQHPQIVPGLASGGGRAYYNGFEHHSHQYNMVMQPKDWSRNSIGSVSHYQHQMTHNHK